MKYINIINSSLMIKIVLCLFVVFFPFYAKGLQEKPSEETMESLFQKCKIAFNSGDFNTAKQHIEKFASLYPESPKSDEIIYMQAFLQPSVNNAMQGYKKLIEKYPNSSFLGKAHFQLGQLYYFQGNYDKALENFGRIIVTYTSDDIYWITRYWRCKALMAKGDYETAINSLNSLLDSAFRELGKDTILMALGSCYMFMEKYDKAQATYASLIESIPGSPWVPSANILMAKSLQNIGKINEMKPLLQRLIETYPESIEAQQAKDLLASLSPEKILSEKPQEKTEVIKSKPLEENVKAPKISSSTPKKPDHYFSIQVGAFSSKDIADALANDLRSKGYYVDVIRSSTEKGILHKVRVGIFNSREEALKIEQELKKIKETSSTNIVYE